MWRNWCEISCGQFPWKLKDENQQKFHQNFAAFFISLLEMYGQNFHPTFVLGNYGRKNKLHDKPPKGWSQKLQRKCTTLAMTKQEGSRIYRETDWDLCPQGKFCTMHFCILPCLYMEVWRWGGFGGERLRKYLS